MFDAKKETTKIIEFIRDYYKKYNLRGVVLGISGGKDSAVVAGLFSKALGSNNVIGLTLPCHSNEDDRTGAKIISDYYGFKLLNLDLTSIYDSFLKEFDKNLSSLGISSDNLKDSNINLKPRLRMAANYYVAQALSTYKKQGYLVAGTSNLCELYVGYFTKGGDNVHDISVLGDLTVEEVIKVGEEIKVPKEILYKTPSDGLSDMSDEDKLGVKYSDIASVIYNEKVDIIEREKIDKLHNSNRHKFNIPTYRKDEFKC